MLQGCAVRYFNNEAESESERLVVWCTGDGRKDLMRAAWQVFVSMLVLMVSATSAQSVVSPAADTHSINPLAKFEGEWTLKNDAWSQNWGGHTENIKIPNHHTTCRTINTDLSVLCVVDTPPTGHILWAFNPVKKKVHHLSSFGEVRIGVGQGSLNDRGDLRLKVSFEGEAAGTYRIYNYVWINADEYDMRSVQYAASDKMTGLFYAGRFIRR